MKKFPKIIQSDERGQIVIPKEVRRALGVEAGSGFFVYAIEDEGILLKLISEPDIAQDPISKKLHENSDKLDLDKKKLKKSIDSYKRKKKGGLELV